jgi:hypothetical protein
MVQGDVDSGLRCSSACLVATAVPTSRVMASSQSDAFASCLSDKCREQRGTPVS